DLLAISTDGLRVRFKYEPLGWASGLFSLPEFQLASDDPGDELVPTRFEAPGIAVEGWFDGPKPTLNGRLLALEPYETPRSLAVAPDGRRFVLGAEWSLRLFDQAGT